MWQKAGSLAEIQFLPEPMCEICLKHHSSLLAVQITISNQQIVFILP